MNQSNEWMRLNLIDQKTIEKYQNDMPIKLGLLSKELGLVVKRATLPANISGEIKEQDGEVIIRVNRHDAKTRQRYTLAHEIAHFLLHRHLLSNGITDDVLYRSSQSDEIEAEANRLAADILMPMHIVKNLMQKHDKLKGENFYQAIADDLDVSVTAIKIRLNKM
ncbi:ImmA/IrrE family metallo-endopeptidase [Acinetobacter indicus]|uniref:ImmA/IrrE family metallo-endopeptidase n=1 Tax=Acinetobacter indicus TaxID=756892 RepID=UPI0014403008|nr:ImmA/IrrE family metallo-endopeptidase [Acinetobacter indicus]MDM1290811.1 ImmA/IrrE family metallo-endopeptidase [Acinetobacter indicus]MDM1320826.1 ImmA/IrrE family metallo-endopeptidase [Acinetobacter indicus]MDM1332667.1 ImmA/IrrE family metallo-endopeptidase [Acinetobacter indicus]QIZ59492.1 ImmA/IrrE family metallo-endopeptidase [Acinetobacter indicus]